MLPGLWSSQDHARDQDWFYSFLIMSIVNVLFAVFVSLFFILWAFNNLLVFNQVQPTSLVIAT